MLLLLFTMPPIIAIEGLLRSDSFLRMQSIHFKETVLRGTSVHTYMFKRYKFVRKTYISRLSIFTNLGTYLYPRNIPISQKLGMGSHFVNVFRFVLV